MTCEWPQCSSFSPLFPPSSFLPSFLLLSFLVPSLLLLSFPLSSFPPSSFSPSSFPPSSFSPSSFPPCPFLPLSWETGMFRPSYQHQLFCYYHDSLGNIQQRQYTSYIASRLSKNVRNSVRAMVVEKLSTRTEHHFLLNVARQPLHHIMTRHNENHSQLVSLQNLSFSASSPQGQESWHLVRGGLGTRLTNTHTYVLLVQVISF